jgi:hypothetical protein
MLTNPDDGMIRPGVEFFCTDVEEAVSLCALSPGEEMLISNRMVHSAISTS